MADFDQPLAMDKIVETPNINMGTTGSLTDTRRSSDDLWTADDAHWERSFHTRPYARADRSYEHYRPAYRYGHESAHRHQGRDWHEVESDLSRDWHSARGTSHSTWDEARDAVRDAWEHARGRR